MRNPMKISDIGFLKTEPTSKFKNRKLGFRCSVFKKPTLVVWGWPVALCFQAVCESVHACGTLLTQCLQNYLMYFHQTFGTGVFGTRMCASAFGIKRSEFKVTVCREFIPGPLFSFPGIRERPFSFPGFPGARE